LMALVFFYYNFSLLFYSLLRLLTFRLFARGEAGPFLRLSLVWYGLNIAFDLFFVGVLGLGAKGIPLGMLGSSVVACVMAWRATWAN